MLKNGSENSAEKDHQEDPHQDVGEAEAKTKSSVKQDQRKTDSAQPEMAAHPGLCSADAEDGKLLTRSQEPGEQHERRPNAPVGKPNYAAAAGSLGRAVP